MNDKTLNGISAPQMQSMHPPLFATNGFKLEGGLIEITGLALAPDGDPSRVAFTADKGIQFRVEYPLPNRAAQAVYWYWPGSDNSAFRITIDLAATQHVGPYYNFNVLFDGLSDRLELIRTRFSVPKDIGVCQNFPSTDYMSRVQRFETINSVALSGTDAARRMVEIANYYGWNGRGNVLDWGVGHGRVARHIAKFAKSANVYGVDIDPVNIKWAQTNLDQTIDASLGPLMPPSTYPREFFSLVYGLSVMTHLATDVQDAWLAEISQLLKSGGLAILTFAGDGSVAFSSRYLTGKWISEYLQTGRGPYLQDKSLIGVIQNPDYYKNVSQNIKVSAAICEKHMNVVASHECMFGYQDVLVMRKGIAN